jgi:predicted MarR family transcription regulator
MPDSRTSLVNPIRNDDAYMTSTPCAAALTRIELATVRVFEAFSRWATELNNFVTSEHLAYQDAALLHCLRLRHGVRNLSEIMMFMNRTDVSNIQYSLRKLERANLVKRVAGASKRESSYYLTDHGKEVTDIYGTVRQELLVRLAGDIVGFEQQVADAAAVLERMVGLYDQSTQSLLNQGIAGFEKF